MADRSLGSDIRRLVDRDVPAAPWLEERVMARVIDQAAGRRTIGSRRQGPGLVMAAMAAIVIAVLVVGVLLGSGLAQRSFPAPASTASPSKDPAVIQYRSLIGRDFGLISNSYGINAYCNSRETCIAKLLKTRTATESLVRDVSTTQAPPAVATYGAEVQVAAERFIAQLNLALVALASPDADIVEISYAISITDLVRAVASVECWPVVPVIRIDLPNLYTCTSGRTVWDELGDSI